MRVGRHIGALSLFVGLACTFGASGGSGHGATIGDAESSGGDMAMSTGEGPDAPAGETTGEITGDPSTEDTGEPGAEHLQHTDQTACDDPMWCGDGGLLNGSTGAQMVAECFTSTLLGPLAITRLHFVMPAFSETAAPFVMRVWSATGAGPGGKLHEQPLVPATLHRGSNEIRFDPPLVVDAPSFCIGFDVPAQGPAGAVGFAVDSPHEEQGISYTRFPDGSGPCDYADWADLATAPITPPGNWCFDVDVTGAG